MAMSLNLTLDFAAAGADHPAAATHSAVAMLNARDLCMWSLLLLLGKPQLPTSRARSAYLIACHGSKNRELSHGGATTNGGGLSVATQPRSGAFAVARNERMICCAQGPAEGGP